MLRHAGSYMGRRMGVTVRHRISLEGAVCVVTGGGSGIGRASARRLAREGAHVYVCDLDGQTAESVAGAIRADGGRAEHRAIDVCDDQLVESLAQEVHDRHGAIDVLLNNAGIGHAGAVQHTTADDWCRVIDINLLGVAHGCHAFAPFMIEQERPAVIINTASQAGLVPVARMAPYVASKFGVVGLSLALNAELAPQGVRVVALCPGVVDTGIIAATTLSGVDEGVRESAQTFYSDRGVSADRVAEDVVRAVSRPRLVVHSPSSQVLAPALLQRLSPSLMQHFSRLAPRVIGLDPSTSRHGSKDPA